MKRVLCVLSLAVLAASPVAFAGGSDAPASLYDALGYLNLPTGNYASSGEMPYQLGADPFPHATDTPEITHVHSLESPQGFSINVPVAPFPGTNVFTEYFHPSISTVLPFYTDGFGNPANGNLFPTNSALVEIHYSAQVNNSLGSGVLADGVFIICTVCQDQLGGDGVYESCVPCANTLINPNMMRQLDTESYGNLIVTTYSGHAIVDAFFPTMLTIDLAKISAATPITDANNNNLVLRYPGEPRPQALPPTSEDNFRRRR